VNDIYIDCFFFSGFFVNGINGVLFFGADYKDMYITCISNNKLLTYDFRLKNLLDLPLLFLKLRYGFLDVKCDDDDEVVVAAAVVVVSVIRALLYLRFDDDDEVDGREFKNCCVERMLD
jgi:hypothetical protein